MKRTTLILLLAIPGFGLQAHEGMHRDLDGHSALLEKHGNHVPIRVKRAKMLILHKEYDKAEADYFHLLKQVPKRKETHLELAKLYLIQDRHDDALAQLVLFEKAQKHHEDGLYTKAKVLAAKNDYEGSAAALTTLIEVAKEPQPWMYASRAKMHGRIGDTGVMEAGLNEGIAKLGHFPALDEGLLALELKQGKHEVVLARYDLLIKSDPFRWLEEKALYLKKHGREKEAKGATIELLKRFRKLPPNRMKAPHFVAQLERVKKELR